MKAIVAMSGGVDSSTAMLLAIERFGRDNVCGVTLCLAEQGSVGEAADIQNCADAGATCETLGVPHTSLYAYPQFSEYVIDYFTRTYLEGRTPNPCVVCNKTIKFGLLYDYARENGYSRIVTGHYAVTEERGGITYLKRAADPRKDQSYVLAGLSQEQLSAAVFPLGGMTKQEVRALAEAHGFVSAKRSDSQDICFIPDGDYAAFIKERCGIGDDPGEYVDESGNVLGRHKGQWQYTIGQRKGLGISMGRHVFVLDKSAESNRVTLGDETALFCTEVKLCNVGYISGAAAVREGERYMVKLRYAHRPSTAVVHIGESDEVSATSATLVFDEPQRAPTPGQLAVIYDSDTVICSGDIVSGLRPRA